jgi:hypothetical protein
MSVTRIDPPIAVDTPKGKGWAHFLIDYSQDTSLVWVVFIEETRECWCVTNEDIRSQPTWTWNSKQ